MDEDDTDFADPLDLLDEFAQAERAELAKDAAPIEKRTKEDLSAETRDRIRKIEDGIMETCLVIMGDALAFRDIDPGDTEPPPDWQDMDPGEAKKRLRIARAAHMSKKNAPVGLELATRIYGGMQKTRAVEKMIGPRTLNVAVVNMTAPLPTFGEIIVTKED